MPEPLTHAQRMQQKERELWAQIREQLATPKTTRSASSEELLVAEVEIGGVITTTPQEQDAIRRWLQGLG